jgi:hypothetical protein
MGIFSNLKEFIFRRKKKTDDEIHQAMERINPVKFYEALAEYGQSLGLSVEEGINDSGFTAEPNFAVNGIQFGIYGICLAVCMNTWMYDGNTPGIIFCVKHRAFNGPYTKPVLDMCKAELEEAVKVMKNWKQQVKLDKLNEDFEV